MNDLDKVLTGIEQELELERELGVRTADFDRNLLVEMIRGESSAASAVQATPSGISANCPHDVRGNRNDRSSVSSVGAFRRNAQSESPSQTTSPEPQAVNYDFVFLHDRPLSSRGIEMMAKIILAMGKTADTAPIIVAPPVPKAKAYVILGGLALKKFLPQQKGEPGQWLVTPGGSPALVTYSPEYILRFTTVTPAVAQLKKSMWLSLKTVMQRVAITQKS